MGKSHQIHKQAYLILTSQFTEKSFETVTSQRVVHISFKAYLSKTCNFISPAWVKYSFGQRDVKTNKIYGLK